jgi:hypothetical protein
LAEARSVAITAALITAAATIAAALIATKPWDDGGGPGPPPDTSTPTVQVSVFLSRDSGPGGTSVNVSGEGFLPGERIVLFFHTQQIGSTTASDQGGFANVAVAVPTSFSDFAPQQFFLFAHGERSSRTAQTPFTLTG